MNAIIENIMERPTSHKIGLWIGSLLLLTFVFWQYFYKAKLTEFAELREKVENLEQQKTLEKRRAASLDTLRKLVKDLDIKLKFALQELPDKREIPDLLDSISNLARDAGLEVTLFKPEAEILRDFYAEVPVSISVDGTFHQVTTFFDEVGHLSRIVNINQITIREPRITEERVGVKVDCMATTFRYLDEAERQRAKEIEESDSNKRKRK